MTRPAHAWHAAGITVASRPYPSAQASTSSCRCERMPSGNEAIDGSTVRRLCVRAKSSDGCPRRALSQSMMPEIREASSTSRLSGCQSRWSSASPTGRSAMARPAANGWTPSVEHVDDRGRSDELVHAALHLAHQTSPAPRARRVVDEHLVQRTTGKPRQEHGVDLHGRDPSNQTGNRQPRSQGSGHGGQPSIGERVRGREPQDEGVSRRTNLPRRAARSAGSGLDDGIRAEAEAPYDVRKHHPDRHRRGWVSRPAPSPSAPPTGAATREPRMGSRSNRSRGRSCRRHRPRGSRRG